MRNYYNKGGPTLTKAQKTLPEALKKKILMSKNKKKKTTKPSPIMMAMSTKGKK